ncbi:MAG: hypothetical protein H5U12_32315, partial [Hoeflea sp.]|nr:hypothetical protein [Hoeflea sp.]
KGRGFSAARYNQVANFVIAQSEINIAIGDKAPDVYFSELADQCSGGGQRYGGITDFDEMRANLETNCVPASMLNGSIPDYDDFLEERRTMMAGKIKLYFKSL